MSISPENCHYVSRFIMKPWISKNALRPSVSYIDIESGTIKRRRLEGLFTKKGLNSAIVEDRLNRHIETPLAQDVQKIIADPQAALNDKDIRCALCLLLDIQILRYAATSEKRSDLLEHILTRLDTVPGYKETYGAIHLQERQIVFVKLRSRDYLFYPETGYFPIPLVAADEPAPAFKWAIAIPFAPTLIVVSVPKGADSSSLTIAPQSQWSTITATGATRYVVSPQLLNLIPEDDIIEEFFRLRQSTVDAIELMQQMRFIKEGMSRAFFGSTSADEELATFEAKYGQRFGEIEKRQEDFMKSPFGQQLLKYLGRQRRGGE